MPVSQSSPISSDTSSGILPLTALLMVCWLILCWPWLSGEVTIPWDTKAQFQPQIQFLAHSLHTGQSPFWTPNVFSGHPQIADPQSLVFQPPFLILAFFNSAPGARAIDLTILLCILAGALALIAWCRDQRWHLGASLLTGLAFAFGAAMAWRLQHTGQVLSMCYLALVLLCLDRALARRSICYAIAAGGSAALMVLGRDQVALLGVYFLAGFVIWRHFVSIGSAAQQTPMQHLKLNLAPLATAAIVGIVLVTLPILLTYLMAEGSNRPAIDLEGAGRGSLHPALLLTAITPDVFGSSGRMEDYWGPPSFAWSDTGLFIAQNMGQLYVGAVPLMLILAGLFSGDLFAREIRFFTWATFALLLYALGWYTPLFSLAHSYLPGIDYYRRPADAVFLIGFAAAILSGYSANRLLFAQPVGGEVVLSRTTIALITGTLVTALLSAMYLAWQFDRVDVARAPLLLAMLIFVSAGLAICAAKWLVPTQPLAASILLIAFTVADLKINNGPGSATALPSAHYEVLEPDTSNETIRFLKDNIRQTDTYRDRVEMAGLGFHWPNASLTHDLEHISGYNPVRTGLYVAATATPDTVGGRSQRKFSPLFPSYTSLMGNMLGLRFIATGVPIEKIDKQADQTALALVKRTPTTWIYENKQALPRVLFAHKARRAEFASLLKTGDWPDFDPTTTVLLDSQTNESTEPGQARILSYENTIITISADSPSGGFVVLNDVWHPWWTVTVDNKPAVIHRANILFRAVRVPAGKHVIQFTFEPVRSGVATIYNRIMTGNPTETSQPARQRK